MLYFNALIDLKDDFGPVRFLTPVTFDPGDADHFAAAASPVLRGTPSMVRLQSRKAELGAWVHFSPTAACPVLCTYAPEVLDVPCTLSAPVLLSLPSFVLTPSMSDRCVHYRACTVVL